MGDISAILSGVYALDTLMYRGFTPQLFNDMLTVFLKSSESEHGAAAINFDPTLYYHLRADRATHGLTIDAIALDLVNKLYGIYRSKGYDGNVTDMLLAIESQIITAEPYDITLGIHPTKAVDVYGWDDMFQRHAVKYKGHPHLFEKLAPQYSFNYEPSFSFNDLFPEGYELYREDGYSLERWNTTQGTWFLEYSFDNKGELDPIDICTLHGATYSYILRVRFEELEFEPYNKAIFMVVEKTNDTGLESIKGQMELDTSILIYEKMVFSYFKNSLFIKGLNSEMTIDGIFQDVPLRLTLDVPFGDRARRGIHTFTYYSRYAHKQELLFFLN